MVSRIPQSIGFAVLVAVVLSHSAMLRNAAADDTFWSGTASADWADPANWSAGVPSASGTTNAYLSDSAAPNTTIVLPGNATSHKLITTGSGFTLTSGTLALADQLYLYNVGARLTLSGGARVSSANAGIGPSTGDVNNKLGVGSTLVVPGTINVGYEGVANVLEVTAGGRVTSGAVYLGGVGGANDNLLDVAAGGIVTATQLIVGYGGSGNSATFAGSGTSSQTVVGFQGTAANNTLTVGPGGRLTNAGPLTVGGSGTGNKIQVTSGTLTVTGGANDVVVGEAAAAVGNSIAVSGGSFTSAATLVIGGSASGNSFTASNGAQVTSVRGRLGLSAGATGNVATVDGAGTQWTITDKLRVGSDGDGNSLNITGGGHVTVTSDVFVGGISPGSNVSNNAITISGSGSKLGITSGAADLVVAYGSGTNNTVTVTDSGTLDVASVQMGPYGTLAIGSGSGAGFVRSSAVISGTSGGGTVAFDHADADYQFPNPIRGTARVLQRGTGRTVLTGTGHSYTGPTIVSSGTLALVGATNPIASSGTIEVHGGAGLDVGGVLGGFVLGSGKTIAGKGTVSGTVTAGSGSIVSPGLGDIGTLSFDTSLALEGLLKLDISAASVDSLIVAGALSLDPSSSIEFLSGGSLTSEVYVLATYGSRIGTFGTVTNLPAGYRINYAYEGNKVALQAVPEPGTIALAAIGGCCALGLVRRRRKRA